MCDLEYARRSNFSYLCASHMTENVLPGDGFFARTPNVQLFTYEHLYYTTKEALLQHLKRLKCMKPSYPTAEARGPWAIFVRQGYRLQVIGVLTTDY